MRVRSGEAGFTLIEMIVVAAVLVLAVGGAGTFFLGGASPAVASAQRDVNAAFDEARATALAFDDATVVFVPAATGSGYAARVYERLPGDAAFRARSGPAYESTVTIGETASPLGAPGFAFGIDSHGAVTGYADFSPGDMRIAIRPCPPSGAFTLLLRREHEQRTIAIPCVLPLGLASPVALLTPAAGLSPAPPPSPVCPEPGACTLAQIPPPGAPVCPPDTTPDASIAGQCDAVAEPTAAPLQQLVCTTDARAGQTLAGVAYVGTTASPPCAPAAASKAFVCSSLPYGTDLGPDPDGRHEDVSDGVACITVLAGGSATIAMKGTCTNLPHGDFVCNDGALAVLAFAAASDSIALSANIRIANDVTDVKTFSVRNANVTLVTPSAHRYCVALDTVTGSGDAPQITLDAESMRLPEGPGSYALDLSGLTSGEFAGDEPTNGSMFWQASVNELGPGLGTTTLSSTCS